MKIESRPAVNLFPLHFYFRGNIVLYTVSCLLWCLPELSYDKKSRHNKLCVYTTIVLTYWPILTLLHSFLHEGMLLCSVDQWFSKWSISTSRGQLDHPNGR